MCINSTAEFFSKIFEKGALNQILLLLQLLLVLLLTNTNNNNNAPLFSLVSVPVTHCEIIMTEEKLCKEILLSGETAHRTV